MSGIQIGVQVKTITIVDVAGNKFPLHTFGSPQELVDYLQAFVDEMRLALQQQPTSANTPMPSQE